MPTDVSPSSPVADASSLSSSAANSPGDGFGSSSIAFGTEIVKACPPRPNRYTRVYGWHYNCGGTAHTVTVMVSLSSTTTPGAAAGQAVINLDALPTDPAGAPLAAGDFIVVKDIQGIFGVYKVASLSGTAVTVTTSVGNADSSGFVYAIPAGRTVWHFGAPGDHAKRQFATIASAFHYYGNDIVGVGTATGVGEPVVVHSNNATATGYLYGPYYGNVAL